MFKVAEPDNAIEGIADFDFVGLASANRGSTMHRLLAQWARSGHSI